jgi:hypothetical protein
MAARLAADRVTAPPIRHGGPAILTPARPARARAPARPLLAPPPLAAVAAPAAPLAAAAAAAAALSAAPPAPPSRAAAATTPPPPPPPALAGHSALLHGLGDVGDVPPAHMPALLRAAHAAERRRRALERRARAAEADADAAEPPRPTQQQQHQQHQLLPEFARGYCAWRGALSEGLLPACDDEHLSVAGAGAGGSGRAGGASADLVLVWPPEPLRTTLVRVMAKLGVARFAHKYPAVREALMRSVLDAVAAFELEATPAEWADEKGSASGGEGGDPQQPPQNEGAAASAAADPTESQKHRTAADLAAEDLERRARRAAAARSLGADTAAADDAALASLRARDATVRKAAERAARRAARLAALGPERRAAVEAARALYATWEPAAAALDRAGRAFEGLEALLGGEGFGVTGDAARLWQREGWGALDDLRRRLERLRELRDLVRSLGRGGGWGPLR